MTVWLISDTHFDHEKILKYSPSRAALWDNIGEMNEALVKNWNEVVQPQDKVYHLGDVVFGKNKQTFKTEFWDRLKGKKRLVVGNHDNIKSMVKEGWFQKVMTWRVWHDPVYPYIFTHVPVHEDSIQERLVVSGGVNVHGHIHETPSPEGPYKCVCVEQIGFRPIALEEIRESL